MKHLKLAAVLALTAMVMYSCGDSKSDNPVNGGSDNTSGSSAKGSLATHTGNNAVVTATNVDNVNQLVTTKSFDVFGRAMETVKYGKTAKPAVGTVMNLDGKVNGTNSGYAQVLGTMTVNGTGQNVTGYTYNFTCTYYDFSDETTLYLGGQVTYTGTGTIDMSSGTSMNYNITVVGGLKFNGNYEGTQDFTMKILMSGANMSWTYTGTTTSGGKTFSNTTKYPL
jgi:hypothetical protein